jgi:hypothetical protein
MGIGRGRLWNEGDGENVGRNGNREGDDVGKGKGGEGGEEMGIGRGRMWE